MALKTDSTWQLFVCALIGSCTAEAVTTPIDLVKTRLQTLGPMYPNLNPIYQTTPATNIRSLLPAILAENGLRTFYRGLEPALLRQATYGSMRVGMYEPIKEFVTFDLLHEPRPYRGGGYSSSTQNKGISTGMTTTGLHLTTSQQRKSGKNKNKTDNVHLSIKLLSGMLSGGIAACIACPTDVIKVRMQTDGMCLNNQRRYTSTYDALIKITKHEGIRGLYAGSIPTVQRAGIVAAVELAVYDEIKTSILVDFFELPSKSSLTHILAAITAGCLSAVASSPCDVIKSRIMSHPHVYRGTFHCAVLLVRDEGWRAGFKGVGPAMVRQAPHCVVNYVIMEQLRNRFFSKTLDGG